MFEGITADDDAFVPYHDATPKRSSQVPPELRPFIAWDGEGQNLRGEGKPQSYVLFGCSTGERIRSDSHIHTFDLLDFIIRVGKENPTAFHVGFAFNYDANMILQSLSEPALAIIHKTGKLTLRKEGVRYHINFLPGKWFSVSRYGAKYDRKKNPHDKVSVKIYDLFTFFAKSFIKAYEDIIGDPPPEVVQGKADRNDFANMSLDYVEKYWRIEIEMLRVLAEELRRRVYGAGYRITQWHGPGALASHALRLHGVKKAKALCPEPVRTAASYAYAGGRFEMFRLGRTLGPIYSVDINSAYPFAITRLPSLSTGQWRHVVSPKSIARFGVYRVRLLPTVDGTFLEKAPGPLFHRDARGNISFPWVLEGWYWSPEVMNLFRLSPDRYEIIEGWEYSGTGNGAKPFEWMKETYAKRRAWKKAGNGAQLALKLLMNSIYGKLAQRVGWNEEKRTAPTWHQLEWAGWITSHCRAMLWDVMSRMPRESIVAVETDGLYTTTNPLSLGIVDSSELGGWEVTVYDEILYVQSGMAWLRKGLCESESCPHQYRDGLHKGQKYPGCAWTCKRRGLDAKTFSLEACQSYLASLGPTEQWESYVGETTRFTGLGAALNSSQPTRSIHCRWETTTRDISPGQGGKRIHVSSQCPACMGGATAYQAAHELSIRSLAYKDPMSFPHHIPWEGEAAEPYEWEAVSVGDFGDSNIVGVSP